MKYYFGLLLLALSGTLSAALNPYPTDETVRYVVGCMASLDGRQNDENLYTCTCRYDTIRNALTFSEYEEGLTFERNRKMPGEKGAFFRDNKRGEAFYEKLIQARAESEASCPAVKRVRVMKKEKH